MAAEGKKYAYIEASGKHPGVRATLERLVPVPAGKLKLINRPEARYCTVSAQVPYFSATFNVYN